ncbi:MAG: hypothetical protein AAF639_29715 [Chloroflexota bacterium]
MRYGLLNPSYIPEELQRDLRDLTRYRTRLLQEKSSAANRLHKILEDTNIKLSSVVTDIQGGSAKLMIVALIAENTDAEEIASLAKGTLRKKIPALVEALNGVVRAHHRFMLQEILDHLDQLNQKIHALNVRTDVLLGWPINRKNVLSHLKKHPPVIYFQKMIVNLCTSHRNNLLEY